MSDENYDLQAGAYTMGGLHQGASALPVASQGGGKTSMLLRWLEGVEGVNGSDGTETGVSCRQYAEVTSRFFFALRLFAQTRKAFPSHPPKFPPLL